MRTKNKPFFDSSKPAEEEQNSFSAGIFAACGKSSRLRQSLPKRTEKQYI